MKFTAAAAAVVALAATSAVEASPSPLLWGLDFSLIQSNSWTFFMPTKIPCAGSGPWVRGSLPKWTSPSLNLFCGGKKLPQIWNGDKDFCNLPLWNFTPFCRSGNAPCPRPPVVPPPSGPTCVNQYEQTQSNYTTTPTTGVYAGVPGTGAAASDPSYMTYGLVKSNAECIAMCDKTSGCAYVNVYQDQFPPGEVPQDLINQGLGPKYEVGTLTCSLFSKCLGNSAYTNYAGMNDPSYITNSYGFCKDQACAGKN